MYAVVFQVDLNPDRQGNPDAELDGLIGFVRSQPGFVRGTWTSDEHGRGLSLILFDSEEIARGFAANASQA